MFAKSSWIQASGQSNLAPKPKRRRTAAPRTGGREEKRRGPDLREARAYARRRVVQRRGSGRGPRGAAEQRRGAREGPHRLGWEEARGGWSCAGGRERGSTDTDPRRRFLSFCLFARGLCLSATARAQAHGPRRARGTTCSSSFEMVGRWSVHAGPLTCEQLSYALVCQLVPSQGSRT
jgi:hypothetical protein